MKAYAEFASADMNQILQGAEPTSRGADTELLTQQTQDLLDLFNKSGEVGTRLPSNVVLRRGAATKSLPKLDAYNPQAIEGTVVEFPRFTSASVGPSAGFNHREILYTFEAPARMPALNLMGVTQFPEEREVLLGPGFNGQYLGGGGGH